MATFAPSAYSNPSQAVMALPNTSPASLGLGVGLAGIAAVLLVPTFVITPLVLKGFFPKWSYGRRLLVGMGIGAMAGFSYRLVKASSGQES